MYIKRNPWHGSTKFSWTYSPPFFAIFDDFRVFGMDKWTLPHWARGPRKSGEASVSQDDGIEVEKKPNVISGRKIGMTRPDRLDRIPKEDKNFSPLLKEKPSNVNEQRLSICWRNLNWNWRRQHQPWLNWTQHQTWWLLRKKFWKNLQWIILFWYLKNCYKKILPWIPLQCPVLWLNDCGWSCVWYTPLAYKLPRVGLLYNTHQCISYGRTAKTTKLLNNSMTGRNFKKIFLQWLLRHAIIILFEKNLPNYEVNMIKKKI